MDFWFVLRDFGFVSVWVPFGASSWVVSGPQLLAMETRVLGALMFLVSSLVAEEAHLR